MAEVSLWGAQYSNVPAVTLPKTGGGTVTFYENGGGGGATIKTATKAVSSNATSIQFTGLSAEPLMFYVEAQSDIALTSTSSNRYVTAVFFDGTNMSGKPYALTANRSTTVWHNTSNFSKSYIGGTLTINSGSATTGGYFRSGVTYKLTYVY